MPEPYTLTSLFLYLTDRCNLRCAHCWISPRYSSKKDAGIPLAPLKKIVQEAKTIGLNTVKLTGGEPLLYRDIDELLLFLKDEAIGISIETNGTRIDERIARLFKESGVNQVSVSLDAASKEIHDRLRGSSGAFEKTVRGIRLLTDNDINVQIIMVLQRQNRDEIPDMLKLCDALKASSLKINHLLPFGRATEAFKRGENLDLDELTRRYQWVKEHQGAFSDLNIIFDLPVAFRTLDEIKQEGICECRIHNMLGVLANGDFCICGIGQTAPELRIGNIRTHSIRAVWNKSPILDELRDSLPLKLTGICGDCIFKFQCLGCCRANAYAVSGNLYAPYFLCQTLYDENRFPESRCLNQEITKVN
jgi:SynChlorMet cassette radical SAM/SPASM protein ScmF